LEFASSASGQQSRTQKAEGDSRRDLHLSHTAAHTILSFVLHGDSQSELSR